MRGLGKFKSGFGGLKTFGRLLRNVCSLALILLRLNPQQRFQLSATKPQPHRPTR